MSAFSFSRGSKKKLEPKDLQIFDGTDVADANKSVKKHKEVLHMRKQGFHLLQKDLDHAYELIAAVDEMFAKTATDISSYLFEKEDKEARCRSDVNVYGVGSSVLGIFRSAVIQCSFTDLTQLINAVRTKSQHSVSKLVQISSVDRSVNSIVDMCTELAKDKMSKGKPCLLVLEQAESLEPGWLDRLLMLLRPIQPIPRLLVCVSTHPAVFAGLCSQATLYSISPHMFKMETPDKMYGMIAYKLANNLNSTLQLSGELLKDMRKQFMCGDHSWQSLRKTLRLALCRHTICNMKWHTEDAREFERSIPEYWTWLEVLYKLIVNVGNEDHSVDTGSIGTREERMLEIHELLQTENQKFWLFDGLNSQWRQALGRMPPDELFTTVSEVMKDTQGTERCDEMRKKVMEKCEELLQKEKEETKEDIEAKYDAPAKETATPSKKKMTMAEMQAAMKLKMKTTEGGVRSKQKEVIVCLEKVLKEMCFEWIKMTGAKSRIVMAVEGGDRGDPRAIAAPKLAMEKALLGREEYAKTPLAIAMRSLLAQEWKSVMLQDWGEDFTAMGGGEKAAFTAAIGELENIGVIRHAGERKQGAVAVLFHPIQHIV